MGHFQAHSHSGQLGLSPTLHLWAGEGCGAPRGPFPEGRGRCGTHSPAPISPCCGLLPRGCNSPALQATRIPCSSAQCSWLLVMRSQPLSCPHHPIEFSALGFLNCLQLLEKLLLISSPPSGPIPTPVSLLHSPNNSPSFMSQGNITSPRKPSLTDTPMALVRFTVLMLLRLVITQDCHHLLSVSVWEVTGACVIFIGH